MKYKMFDKVFDVFIALNIPINNGNPHIATLKLINYYLMPTT